MIFRPKIQCFNRLGEGPVWHPLEQCLYWVDIPVGKVFRFDPARIALQCFALDGNVGCLMPLATGGVLAAASSHWQVLTTDGEVRRARPTGLAPSHRFNDGKVSPAGNIWVGEMALEQTLGQGRLVRCHPDGTDLLLSDLTVPNGLGWDTDRGRFYHIDTPTGQIRCFEYDGATDELGEPLGHLSFAGPGYADGLCVDAEGLLWLAHYAGGCVTRWDPDSGKQVAQFAVPVQHATCPVFGGERLDTLFVSSARDGSPGGLHDGALLAAQAPVQGTLPQLLHWIPE